MRISDWSSDVCSSDLAMDDGIVRGLFLMGQNVVIGGSNSKLIQRGLGKLDWLVVRDTDEIESANFWAKGHAVRDGELRPEEIKTEIFLMPAELAGEKEGTFTKIGRASCRDRVCQYV